MSSQLDLDQGGTSREWQKVYMGPSIGWVSRPVQNVLSITAAGTYTLDRSTNYVNVNVAGLVTINLPSALSSLAGAGANPGTYVQNPIVILDTGGNSSTFAITIVPAAGDTIMGLASVQLASNFGAFSLAPNSAQRTWNQISP